MVCFNLTMSNSENSQCEESETQIETYKCSQCNFYTNHEYYLQQHNVTHGLQTLIMDNHKLNTDCFDNNSISPISLKVTSSVENVEEKLYQCIECSFRTANELFFKAHVLTHTTQSSVSVNLYSTSYKVDELQEFKNTEENHIIKSDDVANNAQVFSSAENFSSEAEMADGKSYNLVENYSSLDSHPDPIDIKLVDEKIILTNSELTNNCNKNVENSVEKKVFRCDSCNYESNLKAFLKRHLLSHSAKLEIKEELPDKFQCSQCDFQTQHEKFLKRHELSHQQVILFNCSKCSFVTLYKKIYLLHIKAHKLKINGDKTKLNKKSVNNKCSKCNFEAGSLELLTIHKESKHIGINNKIDLSLFRCTYCKYQTNWEPCLKRHIERKHPNCSKSNNISNKAKKDKDNVKEEVEVKADEPNSESCKNNDLFRCDDCDFTSKTKQYLVSHLKLSHINTEKFDKTKLRSYNKRKPDKTMLYECKFRNCSFLTSIKSNYVYHLRKHQSQNPHRTMFHICDLCDFVAKSEENLEEHKKRLHLNHLRQMYKCNQCDFKTQFKHSLKTHSIKHKSYTCMVCNEELESAYALVKHKRIHQVNSKNWIYLCDTCGFQSKNDRSLKMHKKTHNPEFQCPDCPFQTHSKVNFQNHCINHKSADEVTMFPCPHCSYQSRLKRNLAWHMKRHADPSKAQIFKCPSCEYQTFTNAQLKSHLMVHKSKEEVIMLKCDFCTFETKRKSNMVQHRLRHLKDSPDVPLLSCPDCNYTTVAKRHLNKHRKTHNVNPDKMFQCSYCPYKIHRKIYLVRHMDNHKTLETFGNSHQWQRYTFPPQPQLNITGVTVIPNLGQNIHHNNIGHNLM